VNGQTPVSQDSREEDVLLSARNLNLSFGGVRAVRDVEFDIGRGEVFALIGPNGAGKTTVFNLINRLYDVDGDGRMIFDGQDITKIPPYEVARRGIARTFQNTELFEHETVLKNLLIGRHVHRKTNLISEFMFTPAVARQELAFRKVAEDIIDLLDLQHYRDQVIAGLPYGVRKMVEVARALCLQPKLLLLDEPSSGLNPEETEDVAFWLEDINEDYGVTVIMIEHDMNLVSHTANRVMAMDEGAVLALGTPEEVRNHPKVAQAYLGD
jgi:branched-chain amino acid transport system ATP-binding protein